MKNNLLIFLATIALLLLFPSFCGAECSEDPVDLGYCDTLLIIPSPWLYCSAGDTFPCLLYIDLLVTHDSNTFWWAGANRWVQDSIAAFGIPLYWTHTNPTAYCSLTTWGPPYYYVNVSNDSSWYYYSASWWGSLYLDSAFVPPHFWMALTGAGQRWPEGNRVLLTRLEFKIQDTMHIFIDTTFWPPELSLQFVRFDGSEYRPRHNLPISIWVNPGSVAGNVRNASTLQPVKDAWVFAMQGAEGISDGTDADGNYNIRGLLSGIYDVRAEKRGYETKTYNGVQVTAGQTTTRDFNLNPSPADTVFYDDFWDLNYDDWDTVTKACDWDVDQSGRFVLTAPGERRIWCIASVGDINWTNYIYEADVYGVQGVDKVICFRFIDQNNFYAVNLRSDWGGQDEFTINKRQDGVFSADLFSASYPSQNQTSYHLKVEASGIEQTNIKVSVDDNELINWTDPGTPITHGKIAVAAYSGDYGWVSGLPTIVGFDNILVADLNQRKVGAITIKADHFQELGRGLVKAQGNVWIGDQTGGIWFYYLGPESELTFDMIQGTISNIVHTDVKLRAQNMHYTIDNINSLSIDAQAGQVSFQGKVHYADNAVFPSSFSGACTLEVNLHQFYGRIQFDDSYFGSGTVGIHRGVWHLDECPFFGMSDDINLTMPVGLTDLTVLDGEITLGVFLNTGIFRVGMTNGALEFKESGGAFGLDLTGLLAPPGVPSQGMIDVDLPHLRVNVVKDIPIGLWEYPKGDSAKSDSFDLKSKIVRTDWSTLMKTDQNTYVVDVYDSEGNKHQKFLLDVGLTIKGEETYTDLDCDGYYDIGEPFDDEDGDGIWDEGTNIALLDQSQQPAFDAHGHATLDLTLAQYVNFTCAELILDIDFPNNNIIRLETWSGLKLGNIFEVDLATGILSLDFQNQEYSADATLGHPQFTGLTFAGHLLVAFDPFAFEVGIDNNFKILGVDIYGSGTFLRVDQERLYWDGRLNAFTLLDANGRLIFKWNPLAVDGYFNSDFHIDGWHLSQTANEIHFQPNQCITISASIKLCPIPWFCPGGKVTFRLCSLWDWGVIINGKYIRLKCPADLHVYDSQGRHTGLNQSGGIDLEIPGSEFYFSPDSSLQLIFIPGFDLDGYRIDVKGESTGVIDLDVLYPNSFDLKVYDFTFFDEPTQQGALHRVVLDSTNNWTMLNDLNGDSIFESQSEPDSTSEAILDTSMVMITNVASEIVCANEAKITWKTNVPATSEVLYRSAGDTVYISVSDTILTTSHSVIVDHILTTDTYYYIVVSVDTSGNIASFLEKTFKLEYIVGDANRDGVINSADVVYLINYLFVYGPPPQPLQTGDANCDGTVNSADVAYLINYLFVGGPPPCK